MTERVVYRSAVDIVIEKTKARGAWIIYVQPAGHECPNCVLLEKFLHINNINYKAINIRLPESATEINICGGCMGGKSNGYPMFTPVLQHGTTVFYKELWLDHGKTLNMDAIKKILDPGKNDWVDVAKEHECKDGVCSL